MSAITRSIYVIQIDLEYSSIYKENNWDLNPNTEQREARSFTTYSFDKTSS